MTCIEIAELDNIFTYHAPHGDQAERYGDLRAATKFLAQQILLKCPEGHERSMAVARVREAAMWANAAIAIGESHVE